MKVKDVKHKVTLDDFEHRLLINCVNQAKTLFLEQWTIVNKMDKMWTKKKNKWLQPVGIFPF